MAETLFNGAEIHGEYKDSKIFPGTVHAFTLVRVGDDCYDDGIPGLVVSQDELNPTEKVRKLVAEGAMPSCVGIYVRSASRPATAPGGFVRSNRSQEYDSLGPDYPNFLVEELIPYLEETYRFRVSRNPNLHFIYGSSSGGISAWNACWERNDWFRRCYIASPTFCSFRGGDQLPVLIRKYETKPIRCYMTVGTEDMRNSAGDWFVQAHAAARAMDYAGYDFFFNVFGGGRHGCGVGVPDLLEDVLRFCWKDWDKEPVRPRHLSPRVADMISMDSAWMRTNEPVPEKEAPATGLGSYHFEEGSGDIVFRAVDGTERRFPTGLDSISGLALSSDRWRLYIATPSRRFVYAMSVLPDGALADFGKFGHLHLADDFAQSGAYDIVTDVQDRVYAATELGIQTFSSKSENNCVLSLPGHQPVTRLAFGGADRKTLFAASDDRVFKRDWLVAGRTNETPVTEPSTAPF